MHTFASHAVRCAAPALPLPRLLPGQTSCARASAKAASAELAFEKDSAGFGLVKGVLGFVGWWTF